MYLRSEFTFEKTAASAFPRSADELRFNGRTVEFSAAEGRGKGNLRLGLACRLSGKMISAAVRIKAC